MTDTPNGKAWEMSYEAACLWRMARANPTPMTVDRVDFEIEIERLKLESYKEGAESVLAKLKELQR